MITLLHPLSYVGALAAFLFITLSLGTLARLFGGGGGGRSEH